MRERIRLRRDSAANWSANNPILASGEPGVELDSNKLKIGNGIDRWNNLQYLIADSSLSNLIIGDGNNNAIYWRPPDRLNIVGSGGTIVFYDDYTNTISINVPVSPNNNNISNFVPGITPSGLPITTAANGLTVATGINSSLISNFNTSVSGLLPLITGNGYVQTTFSQNTYTISATGLQPTGNYVTNIVGSTGIFVSNDGLSYIIAVTGITGGGNSNVTISNYGDNRVLTSDGSTSGIYAENGLLFDGNNLSISSGLLASTGNFSSGLFVSGIPVSVSGHKHTSSEITDFNASVSGLLPVKNILPGNNVSISSNNGNFTINANGGGGGSPNNFNAVRGSFILTTPSSIFNVHDGYTVGSLDVFLNGVKLSSLGDYDASDGTSFSLAEPAPSGSIIEYLALIPGISLPINSNPVPSATSEFFNCGRLTLSSNDPLADSILSSNTIYFLPYLGNMISLYYNNQWQSYGFGPLSISLDSLSAGRTYDIFIYHLGSNSLSLEIVAWQNNLNIRAIPIVYKDGILVSSSNSEKRYLGTFTANSSSSTADTSNTRLLFNANNQILKDLLAQDLGSPFIYGSSATRLYRNLSSLGVTQAHFTNGLNHSIINIICISNFITETSSSIVGISLDSTTSINTQAFNKSSISSGPALIMQNTSIDIIKPDIGFHTLSLLQNGSSDSTFNTALMKAQLLC